MWSRVSLVECTRICRAATWKAQPETFSTNTLRVSEVLHRAGSGEGRESRPQRNG